MYFTLISTVSKRLLGGRDGGLGDRFISKLKVGYRGRLKDHSWETIFRDKFSIWLYPVQTYNRRSLKLFSRMVDEQSNLAKYMAS